MTDNVNSTTGAQQGSIIPLWHFTFPSPRLDEEPSYREHFLDDDIRQITAVIYATMALFLTLNIIDFSTLEDNPLLGSGIVLRFVVMILGFVLIRFMGSIRRPSMVDWSTIIYATCIAILIVIYHSTGDVSGIRITAIVTLFILIVYIAFPSYAVWGLLPVLILLLGEANAVFSSESDDLIGNRAVMVAAGLFATLMGIMASAYHHRARYQAFRAIGEVKTLSGLLPICSNCKKIRDDQGYYQQIELYVMDHSQAEFSHGVCPECITTLYPDFKKKT
jgi:hypothetical protein